MGNAEDVESWSALEAILKPIMWRNDKLSIGDELPLPGRTIEVRNLCQFHKSPKDGSHANRTSLTSRLQF